MKKLIALVPIIGLSITLCACDMMRDITRELQENYEDYASQIIHTGLSKDIQKEDLPNNALGNQVNDGLTTYHEGRIYFASTSPGIYSILADGSDFRLEGNSWAKDVMIAKDQLYYVDGTNISSIDLKTQEVGSTLPFDESVELIKVTDEYLYYYYQKNIIRSDHTASEQKILKEDASIWNFVLDGDELYYTIFDRDSRLTSIHCMNLSTERDTVLLSGLSNLYSIIVNDGRLYYLVRDNGEDLLDSLCTIYQVTEKTHEVITKIPYNVHSMNGYGDWIYYVRSDKEHYELLCRVNINSGVEEILPDHPTYRLNDQWYLLSKDERVASSYMSLNIVDGWIFYHNVYGRNAYLQALSIKSLDD